LGQPCQLPSLAKNPTECQSCVQAVPPPCARGELSFPRLSTSSQYTVNI
jgi:hypothetical protein